MTEKNNLKILDPRRSRPSTRAMSNCEEDDAAWAAYELADLPCEHGVACQLDAARDEPCRWLPDVNVIVKMQRIATLFLTGKR